MEAIVVSVACVGFGYWGKNLVRNFSGLGALSLICDRETSSLERAASQYPGVDLTQSYSQVLRRDDIEAVVLATPAEAHYQMAREALLANKHVLVEKPLALKVEDGEELVGLARDRSRVLMVGHILEYHPAVRRLKELIDRGELGRINYLYSQRLNLGKVRTEENILWSFAPHDIAVITRLLGEEPFEVTAVGGSYLHHEVADVTVSTLSFGSGARAHIFVSWLHPYKEQRLVVVGDRKMAVFDDVAEEGKLKLYDEGIDWINRMPVPRKKDPEVVEIPDEEPLHNECAHFLDCVEKGTSPLTDGESGLRVLKVLDACQRSLKMKGAPIEVARPKPGYFVHESSYVDRGAKVGEGTTIWHFSHVMEDADIGPNCRIGQNVLVGRRVSIGQGCKVQNNVSIYQGVTLEEFVFLGPSMVFTNVMNPRSAIPRMKELRTTLVKRHATIGANATILCGTTLGAYSFVAAGALVTKNVPDYGLVMGIPARLTGFMCACGIQLDFDGASAVCRACGEAYRKISEESVEPVKEQV